MIINITLFCKYQSRRKKVKLDYQYVCSTLLFDLFSRYRKLPSPKMPSYYIIEYQQQIDNKKLMGHAIAKFSEK